MDQAEGLRNIIKKQEIESGRKTARVITVTSGKGGVGKTSLSVNLAIQLRRLGKRVVVLDADFGLANIEIMLGIRPQYNLADLMFRGKSMNDIITYGPEGIGFISGGSGINEMANLTRDQVFRLIQKMAELDQQADVIIVDTGAGIGDSVLEFVAASAEVLLVATPEPTSITDAYALLKSLNRNSSYKPGKTVVKMVANQVRGNNDADELFDKLGIVVNKFLNIDIEYLGSIPYDANMQKAVMRQEPLSMAAPNAAAARSVENIARILANKEEERSRAFGIMQLFSSVIRMKFTR
ncbi:MAG: MinD/ParA family protein [Eubacterium sp.]|nr:MinD/ParA family protein [Eubacterium sp.]